MSTSRVRRRPPAEPIEAVIFEAGTYRTDLLPGFELPLGRLLALADQWAKADRPRRSRRRGS